MKTILIIYPHWHPANLAGVHRPRLIGNYLTTFGWKPRVLTVEAKYFEERPDLDFERTFSTDFEVTRVKARKIGKPRLIGDIGLRAFCSLYKAARQIIKTEQIDFIWLPIPSFYNALLGRLLYDKTKVPYGIDYIDPWVRDISNQTNKRAILSQKVASILEPYAVKKAALISGVSTPYYAPVIERNFPEFCSQSAVGSQQSAVSSQQLEASNGQLSDGNQQSADNDLTSYPPNNLKNPFTGKPFTHIGMPYGFDPNDHQVKLNNVSYPWKKSSSQSVVGSGQSENNDPTISRPNDLSPSPLTSHHSLLTTNNSKLKTKNLKIWLYAGAFLPNSHLLLEAFFKSIANLRQNKRWDDTIELWFIGTGPYPAKRITAYAKESGIDDIVFENRARYPFLQVLNFLSAADTVMIIGSTEAHYTASKTYQALLSERPVVSVFHHESSAVKVMEDCKADAFTVRYNPTMSEDNLTNSYEQAIKKRLSGDEWKPDLSRLDQYSSKESARKLVEAIETVI